MLDILFLSHSLGTIRMALVEQFLVKIVVFPEIGSF